MKRHEKGARLLFEFFLFMPPRAAALQSYETPVLIQSVGEAPPHLIVTWSCVTHCSTVAQQDLQLDAKLFRHRGRGVNGSGTISRHHKGPLILYFHPFTSLINVITAVISKWTGEKTSERNLEKFIFINYLLQFRNALPPQFSCCKNKLESTG